MNILVTGGSGFVGEHLLRRLAGASPADSNIFSIDLKKPERPVPGVVYIIADVRDLSKIKFPARIDQIFHLAAVHTTPGHSPWEYYETNVLGAIEIGRLAKRHATRSIIFTSSISIYGTSEHAKDECSAPAPTSDYGRSKTMAEKILTDWAVENKERKLVTCRPAVVFGPNENGNFTRLANLLKKGVFVFPGRRDTIKSCIYVKDLIDWIIFAADQPKAQIIFNGCYDDSYTIKQIIDIWVSMSFPKAKTFVIPALALKLLASVLKPLAITGLDIHPERVEKLMISTNVKPTWAKAMGLECRGRLKSALKDWSDESGGTFV